MIQGEDGRRCRRARACSVDPRNAPLDEEDEIGGEGEGVDVEAFDQGGSFSGGLEDAGVRGAAHASTEDLRGAGRRAAGRPMMIGADAGVSMRATRRGVRARRSARPARLRRSEWREARRVGSSAPASTGVVAKASTDTGRPVVGGQAMNRPATCRWPRSARCQSPSRCTASTSPATISVRPCPASPILISASPGAYDRAVQEAAQPLRSTAGSNGNTCWAAWVTRGGAWVMTTVPRANSRSGGIILFGYDRFTSAGDPIAGPLRILFSLNPSVSQRGLDEGQGEARNCPDPAEWPAVVVAEVCRLFSRAIGRASGHFFGTCGAAVHTVCVANRGCGYGRRAWPC